MLFVLKHNQEPRFIVSSASLFFLVINTSCTLNRLFVHDVNAEIGLHLIESWITNFLFSTQKKGTSDQPLTAFLYFVSCYQIW